MMDNLENVEFCPRCGLQQLAAEMGDCRRCLVLETLSQEQRDAVCGAWFDALAQEVGDAPAPQEPVGAALEAPVIEGRGGAFLPSPGGGFRFRRAARRRKG